MINFGIFIFPGRNAYKNQSDGTPKMRNANCNEVCNDNGDCAGT